MADPLSTTLAVVTAAIQSAKSLHETVKRFKDRHKTLSRLQHELDDLTNILESLTQVINAETSVMKLLQGPIDRCTKVCSEFEQSMKVFNEKSKTGFRDWTKMEFMRGDINEFIDTIAGYKSTITVGLGTITMFVTIPLSPINCTDFFYKEYF
jgi:chromosome segregation ATPase